MTRNFLPGPVPVHPRVSEAFARAAISHRGPEFVRDFATLRMHLATLVGGGEVEVLFGSGTLANDAVAAQLSLRAEPGVVLVNGEFGGRLTDHARRFGLTFETVSAEWGEALPYREVDRLLATRPEVGWLWFVHCETSTGVLNDLEALKEITRRRGVDLCVDAISALGTVPVNLEGVWLATGVSSKGLASYPGLALVFHRHQIHPQPALPRYLDLGSYAGKECPPFTTSSNLVYALAASLELMEVDGSGPAGAETAYERCRRLSAWLRGELEAAGWRILAPAEISSPAVFTLAPNGQVSALELGDELAREGFLLSYRSEYLVRRNLIQICLMGEHRREGIQDLLSRLERVPRAARGSAGAPGVESPGVREAAS